jgi:lactate dehydrogenase-like 2-hydroxyacid dehydrogenase
LLVTPFDRIDASFFDRVFESVKIVATRSVGYDHIDTAAAARRHIPVAYTPGVLTDATADATILLLLSARPVMPTTRRGSSAPASGHTPRRSRSWAGS